MIDVNQTYFLKENIKYFKIISCPLGKKLFLNNPEYAGKSLELIDTKLTE